MGKKPVLWVSGVLLGSLGLMGCESPNKNNQMAGMNGGYGAPKVTYGQPGAGQPTVNNRPTFGTMTPGATVGTPGTMTPGGTFVPSATGQPTGMYNPAATGKATYAPGQGGVVNTQGAGLQTTPGYTQAQGYAPTQGAAAANYGVTQAGFQRSNTPGPIDPPSPPPPINSNIETRRTIPTYGTAPITPPSPPPPQAVYENP